MIYSSVTNVRGVPVRRALISFRFGAALAAGLGPHFFDRLPDAERAVGDRQLGPDR